jgi:hypothetical protein
MAQAVNINDIQLFNLLKAKLGEKEAEVLVEYVRASVKQELNDSTNHLATREFVKDEINVVRLEMKEFKSEIIKWMFIFWIGSVLTTLGALFALLKFFIK